MIHDEMARGHGCNGGHFMRYQNDGGMSSLAGYYLINLLFKLFVDITERLIKNEKIGRTYYGTSEETSLELTA